MCGTFFVIFGKLVEWLVILLISCNGFNFCAAKQLKMRYRIFSIKRRGRLFKTRARRPGVYLNPAFIEMEVYFTIFDSLISWSNTLSLLKLQQNIAQPVKTGIKCHRFRLKSIKFKRRREELGAQLRVEYINLTSFI